MALCVTRDDKVSTAVTVKVEGTPRIPAVRWVVRWATTPQSSLPELLPYTAPNRFGMGVVIH